MAQDNEQTPQSNNPHDSNRDEDRLAMGALGGLDHDEMLALMGQVATDEAAGLQLAEYRQVADALGESIPLVEAPAHLAADLRSRVRAEKGRVQQQSSVSAPVRISFLDWLLGRNGQPRYALAGLAAILLLLATNFLSFNNNRTLSAEMAALQADFPMASEQVHNVHAALISPNPFSVKLSASTNTNNGEANCRFVCAPGVAGTLMLSTDSDLLDGELILLLVRKDGTIDRIPATIVLDEDGTGTFTIDGAPTKWGEYERAEIVTEFDESDPENRNPIIEGVFQEA